MISYCFSRVEVPLDQFTNPVSDIKEENDIDVPLPTDQVTIILKKILKKHLLGNVYDVINR